MCDRCRERIRKLVLLSPRVAVRVRWDCACGSRVEFERTPAAGPRLAPGFWLAAGGLAGIGAAILWGWRL
jgi:hypothetical protein